MKPLSQILSYCFFTAKMSLFFLFFMLSSNHCHLFSFYKYVSKDICPKPNNSVFQLHSKAFSKSVSDGLFFSVLALLRSLFLKSLAPSILPLPSWKSYYTSQTICGFSTKAQSDWHAIFHSCWLLLHITKLATSFYVPGFNKIKILSERGLRWNLLFSFSFMIFVVCIFGNTAQRSAWFPKYLLGALKVMSFWASHKICCEVYYCSIYWVSKTRMNLLANPIISFSWPKQMVYQISPRYLCSKDDFFFFSGSPENCNLAPAIMVNCMWVPGKGRGPTLQRGRNLGRL